MLGTLLFFSLQREVRYSSKPEHVEGKNGEKRLLSSMSKLVSDHGVMSATKSRVRCEGIGQWGTLTWFSNQGSQEWPEICWIVKQKRKYCICQQPNSILVILCAFYSVNTGFKFLICKFWIWNVSKLETLWWHSKWKIPNLTSCCELQSKCRCKENSNLRDKGST